MAAAELKTSTSPTKLRQGLSLNNISGIGVWWRPQVKQIRAIKAY